MSLAPTKLPLALMLVCSPSLHAATTLTSSDSNVVALQNSDTTVDSNGEVTFSPSGTNNQGSGFRIDPGSAFNTTVGESTYINFSGVVGNSTLEVFLGLVSAAPASADGRSSNSTAFSVTISTDGIEYYSNGSPTDIGPTSLSVGDVVNFSIVVTNNVDQNNNPFIFKYDLEFEANGTTYSETEIQANGNPQSDVSNYTFNAVGTTTASNILGPVTISDMPIVVVPEPSGSLLVALSLMGLAFIRRRS